MDKEVLGRMASVYAYKGSTAVLAGKYIMVLPKKDFEKLELEGAVAYYKLIRLGWLEPQRRIRIMSLKRFNSFIPKGVGVKFGEGTSTDYWDN